MKLSLFARFTILPFLLVAAAGLRADPPAQLETGMAQHAFDHLGNMGNLAGPAAACGVTVIYCNGVGPGYEPLPAPGVFAGNQHDSLSYINKSKARGIQLAIGYVCATSIVHLDSFDKNWTPQFRAQFHTPPAQWRQLDQNGRVLPSWYDAPYEAACMNNPDWRAYEKFMVRSQLESGCDGIFFDNPTVHPKGCYCPFCMEKFDKFLEAKSGAWRPETHSLAALRQWAVAHPEEFLEFRSTVASDFLADMRSYARTLNPRALITCNNSLNSPDALFSQCRAMGYNINGLSRAEDYILVEDMGSQAHKLADGRVFEYGPTYKQLHAISHGKPIVACTLAEADYYHISPDLARLSMAEAAANDASWLLWPAWPENMRQAAAASIRPEADFLRDNEKLLNRTQPRCDVLLFLCYRRWLETDHCAASSMAATLGRANVQFAVCSEEDLAKDIATAKPLAPVLLIESFSVLNEAERQTIESFKLHGGRVVAGDDQDWMGQLNRAVAAPSVVVRGPSTVRAAMRDQRKRTIIHLYNLDVQRQSPVSFEDQVHPAREIGLTVRVPFRKVRSVRALTSDSDSTRGSLAFTARRDGPGSVIEVTYPRLEISAILVVEP